MATYCQPSIDQNVGSDQSVADVVGGFVDRLLEEVQRPGQEQWLAKVEGHKAHSSWHGCQKAATWQL